MRASNFTVPTMPTLRPKLRKVPRRSFSIAIAFDCSSLRWVSSQHPKSSATHNIAGRLPHLSGVKRTLRLHCEMSANDPKPDIAVTRCLVRLAELLCWNIDIANQSAAVPIEMNIAIQLIFDHHFYCARAETLAGWSGQFGAFHLSP